MNHYELLGVEVDASADRIRSAYRAMAKRLHPDQHPGVGPDEAARLGAAMARLNAAYDALKDPERRAAYDRELSRQPADRASLRAPGPDECVMCGAAPARMLRFEHQNAWVLGATAHILAAVLCHSCGLAVGRMKQNRTLLTGWWGALALLRNLVVVARNGRNLWLAGRLRPPKRRSDRLVALLAEPLHPGRTVWLRSGALLVSAVLTVGIVASAVGGSSDPDTGDAGSGDHLQAPWRVGSCVRGELLVEPVPCSTPNDGTIVARTTSPSRCPLIADSYVDDGSRVWCIDDT